jgi:hypothetical protein
VPDVSVVVPSAFRYDGPVGDLIKDTFMDWEERVVCWRERGGERRRVWGRFGRGFVGRTDCWRDFVPGGVLC